MVQAAAGVVNAVATVGDTNETRRQVCVPVATLNVVAVCVSYAAVGANGDIDRATNVPPAKVSVVERCAVGSVPAAASWAEGLKYRVLVVVVEAPPPEPAVPFCMAA